MREWTAIAMEELVMEMAVKAAAIEERARWRRRGRPAAAARGGGRPAKGERRPLTPFLHDFLVLLISPPPCR